MANNNDTVMPTVEVSDAPTPPRWSSAARPNPDDPRLPYPQVPGQIDYELYKLWREHVSNGLTRNDQMFRRVLNAFMRPYQLTVWMNIIIFAIGVTSFIAAAVFSFLRQEPVFTLIFAGLSAATFLGFFISRPLRALEENLEFITWLGMIYNTYWARVVYAMDQNTVQRDLSEAIKQSSDEIERLVTRHAELAGKRPPTNAG